MLNACLPSRSRGKIIDVRSAGTASHHIGKGQGCMLKRMLKLFHVHVWSGGGVETPAHYPQWKLEHAKFDPPPGLQASFNRLLEGK